MDDRRALELVVEEWDHGHEVGLHEEVENRLAAGQSPEQIAEALARQLGPVDHEVVDEQPDIAHRETLPEEQVGWAIAQLARSMEGEKHADGSGDSYMPTEDPAVSAPQGYQAPDNAENARFQSQAEAKERAMAEGFAPDGRRLRLFELCERKAVYGEQVRWEIRDMESGEVAIEGGPLYLDDPAHSDFALAEARGKAYAQLRDMCNGRYRDLRGSKKMADEIGRKKALLRAQTDGLRLTAAQKAVVADIDERIAELSDEFITSVAGIMKQDWDPGSSWEVVEAGGAAKLVRKETKLDEAPSKHAFRMGQSLRIDAGIVPEDVVVRECVGERRYKVQSVLGGRVFDVDEADLYDPSVEASAFEGNIDLGGIANLF